MLPGIRGVRLTVLRVDAKFEYDDANPVEHRQRVIGHLEQRSTGSTPGPPPSSGGAWPRSVTGRRPGATVTPYAAVPRWRLAAAATLSVQLAPPSRYT
jgi:hypothetical protein